MNSGIFFFVKPLGVRTDGRGAAGLVCVPFDEEGLTFRAFVFSQHFFPVQLCGKNLNLTHTHTQVVGPRSEPSDEFLDIFS